MPHFIVNVAYKSIPVSNLFSTNSKASIPYEETSNVCYQFKCECSSHYIGHTARPVIERIKEHQWKSHAKGIYHHILVCPEYKQKRNIFCLDDRNAYCPKSKKKRTEKQKKIRLFSISLQNTSKKFSVQARKTQNRSVLHPSKAP